MKISSQPLTPFTPAKPQPLPSPPDNYTPGLARRALEGAGALTGRVLGALTLTAPGAMVGALQAADQVPEQAGTNLNVALGFGLPAVGATLGHLCGLPGGGLTGAAGGAALAAAAIFVNISSGGSKRLGAGIEARIPPSNDGAARSVTRGALRGLAEGCVGGGQLGASLGRGLASGLTEGLVDGGRLLLQPPHITASDRSLLQHLVRVPKYTLQVAAGLVGGVSGAATSLLDGTIRGAAAGNKGGYGCSDTDVENRNFIIGLQSWAATTAVGAVLGGGAGALIGAVGGVVVAMATFGLTSGLESISDSNVKVITAVNDQVTSAVANNRPSGDSVSDRLSNTVEGALVGGAAAARTGFGCGFRGGAGMVQAACDGLIGIGQGIEDAFS